MAALNRPTTANYVIHEKVSVDTQDNEDHTFCGIMFPIKAKAILPVEKVVIHSVAVRGQLGGLTVWVSNDNIAPDRQGQYAFRLSPRHWTKVYDKKHKPSQREYKTLDLSASPVVIQPGQVRVLYIHSTMPGDEAIVYDNTASNVPWGAPGPARVEDNFVSIHTGKAHLSPIPFNQSPIWGWGNAWRDRREFVGQLNYGVLYKLWNPERHNLFGTNFHKATESVLALQRRFDSPMSLLPDECVYYILNMCRWDWFDDEGHDLKRRARLRKQRSLEATRQQQQQLQQEQQDATMHDAENVSNEEEDDEDGDTMMENVQSQAAAAPAQVWAVQLVQQQLGFDDSSDDEEAAPAEEDGDESDEESIWERANGYRADNVAFSFRDVSSDEGSDDDESDEEDQAMDAHAPIQHRWLRNPFAGVRFHRPQRQVVRRAVVDDDSDSDFEP